MNLARGDLMMDGHLGGYVVGGDPATQFPALWDWLVDEQGVRSVIDVGCGDGQALAHFRRRGCRVLGVDGIPQNDPDIIQHDYTRGPFVPALADEPPDRFDLCWSCEFVEHVEERFTRNFVETFQCADLVLMTHATPGQPGHHHVNCKERGYWVEWLDAAGYELDERLTVRCRILSAQTDDDWNHFIRSGLAFRRRP